MEELFKMAHMIFERIDIICHFNKHPHHYDN